MGQRQVKGISKALKCWCFWSLGKEFSQDRSESQCWMYPPPTLEIERCVNLCSWRIKIYYLYASLATLIIIFYDRSIFLNSLGSNHVTKMPRIFAGFQAAWTHHGTEDSWCPLGPTQKAWAQIQYRQILQNRRYWSWSFGCPKDEVTFPNQLMMSKTQVMPFSFLYIMNHFGNQNSIYCILFIICPCHYRFGITAYTVRVTPSLSLLSIYIYTYAQIQSI